MLSLKRNGLNSSDISGKLRIDDYTLKAETGERIEGYGDRYLIIMELCGMIQPSWCRGKWVAADGTHIRNSDMLCFIAEIRNGLATLGSVYDAVKSNEFYSTLIGIRGVHSIKSLIMKYGEETELRVFDIEGWIKGCSGYRTIYMHGTKSWEDCYHCGKPFHMHTRAAHLCKFEGRVQGVDMLKHKFNKKGICNTCGMSKTYSFHFNSPCRIEEKTISENRLKDAIQQIEEAIKKDEREYGNMSVGLRRARVIIAEKTGL